MEQSEIVRRLEELAGAVTVTDRPVGDQYTFRLQIPARSSEVPTTQNIPSNMSVVGDSASGTIRPPNIGPSSPTNEERAVGQMLDMLPPQFEVFIGTEGGRGKHLRPHVAFQNVELEVVFDAIRSLNENYLEVFER